MFNSSKEDFGLYEGNPLLRNQSAGGGFNKSYKVSADRLKKRHRRWKYFLVFSFLGSHSFQICVISFGIFRARLSGVSLAVAVNEAEKRCISPMSLRREVA